MWQWSVLCSRLFFPFCLPKKKTIIESGLPFDDRLAFSFATGVTLGSEQRASRFRRRWRGVKLWGIVWHCFSFANVDVVGGSLFSVAPSVVVPFFTRRCRGCLYFWAVVSGFPPLLLRHPWASARFCTVGVARCLAASASCVLGH